jgi:hypothetical protein
VRFTESVTCLLFQLRRSRTIAAVAMTAAKVEDVVPAANK